MKFHDVSEASDPQQKQWRFKLTSDVDFIVSEVFSVDVATCRITLAAGTAVYALKFPTLAALQMFRTQYAYKLLENTHGMYDDKANDQVKWQHCMQQSLCPVMCSAWPTYLCTAAMWLHF